MAAVTPSPAEQAKHPQDDVVLPALRGDLIITQQKYEGRTYYVIKDPISLQYFRLTAEDFFLASLYDGKRTFAQMREAYLARFPHVRLEMAMEAINDRLLKFSADLGLLQFLRIEGMRLKARYDAQKQRKQAKPFLYELANKLFFFRRSIMDPDVIFGKMAKPMWWMWTWPALWISVGIIIAAVGVAYAKWDLLSAHLAGLFTLQNAALLLITNLVVKSIHELGHGLTCKHFGGEVHEVGGMVLVFTPYFFVNVTDSWVMPNRGHRILVSAAGIYVELIIAAFATFAWAIVQPGLLQQFLYNVMLICSVSTIFFNANPLMRFDGYYILTDVLEVPNLQTKSRAMIGMAMKKLLFGKNYTDQSLARLPMPKKRLWLFYTYAVASWLYGYFVIYNLAVFMKPHLAPYGLEGVSTWFSALALTAWVLMPLYAFFKGMNLTLEDWKPHGRLRRLTLIGSISCTTFAALCFYPAELFIKRSIAIELAQPDAVRAVMPGFIREIYVKEGDVVPAGAPIARLENREVEIVYIERAQQAKMAEAELQAALGKDQPSEIRRAETFKAQANARVEQAKRDLDALTLKTTIGGTVLTPGVHTKAGQFLKLGELLCNVAPLENVRIKVPLSESQVRYIQKGQLVDFRVAAYHGQTLQGRIIEKPLLKMGADLPATLSKERSGDVPTAQDNEGRDIPLAETYEAVVEVENPKGLLRPGMTGRANIHAGRHAFGKLLLQSILNLISLDLRYVVG